MIELPSKTVIYDPSVIERDGENTKVVRKRGKYYRVFPMTPREIEYVRNMELGVDKFAPEKGNGIIISSRLLDGKEVSGFREKITLPVLSEKEARTLGYSKITNPILVESEQAIIISAQSGMKGRDAVWISEPKNKDDPKSTPDHAYSLGVKQAIVIGDENK